MIIFLFLENKKTEVVITQKEQSALTNPSPYRDKLYLFFLPISMLYAISFFQFFSTMPLYYKQVAHLSETQIGWMMALNGALVAAVEMIMIYKIENRWTMYNFIALGASLLVISYLFLLIINGIWWLLMITVLISFSEMFALPFMNTFMNSRSIAANKGQYASLYVMSWSAAQIITPVIATQVIVHSGYNALWIVFATLALMVFAGIKMLGRFNINRNPGLTL